MSKIFVSGLINTETSVSISGFPIEYEPIGFPFFGVNTCIGGVGFNITSALTSLKDQVTLFSLLGSDASADMIHAELTKRNISSDGILPLLKATPQSVVLYDSNGKRRIYCDLKDIQESVIPQLPILEKMKDCNLAVICNINYNRTLLPIAKKLGKVIATDVHVISTVDDEYNRDFMSLANILFLSNENIIGREEEFVLDLASKYGCSIIVVGCGDKGACLYQREKGIKFFNAQKPDRIINTVGAGDALFSAFICKYLRCGNAEIALEAAQKFAAYKIGFSGAAEGFLTEI